MLYIIFGVFALLSWLTSRKLQSKFDTYSKVPLNLTGAEMAKRMLADHGINNVTILSTNGKLTDHYNPTDHTINLSADVFNGRSVAAAAVAAHETGHAIQHASAYAPLALRSALVPIQNISATILNWIFIAMFALSFFMPAFLPYGLMIIVAAYAIMTLTAFVTLGVEIDASKRAISWLTESGIVVGETRENAKDALKWAAYTYVIAALSYLATLVYYIIRLRGRD